MLNENAENYFQLNLHFRICIKYIVDGIDIQFEYIFLQFEFNRETKS